MFLRMQNLQCHSFGMGPLRTRFTATDRTPLSLSCHVGAEPVREKCRAEGFGSPQAGFVAQGSSTQDIKDVQRCENVVYIYINGKFCLHRLVTIAEGCTPYPMSNPCAERA